MGRNPCKSPSQQFSWSETLASGDEMVLVCHMILKDHVAKALKSAITIFSKAHGMSYSHIRNFTITVAFTKIFCQCAQ